MLTRLPVLTYLALVVGCARPAQSPATTAEAPTAQAPSAAASEGLPDRDPALAHRLVEQEGAVLLDVRTPEEFGEGHVAGATNIPQDQIESQMAQVEALTHGDKSAPIVVYCRSGKRAGLAKDTLVQHGYKRVTNVGGMADYTGQPGPQ